MERTELIMEAKMEDLMCSNLVCRTNIIFVVWITWNVAPPVSWTNYLET